MKIMYPSTIHEKQTTAELLRLTCGVVTMLECSSMRNVAVTIGRKRSLKPGVSNPMMYWSHKNIATSMLT